MHKHFSGRRRLLGVALAATLAVGCADKPVLEPLTSERPDLTAGPAAGYPVVIVRASGGPASEAGAPVVNDLAEAVARVRDGGTIRVHPGTYVADGIVVEKAVTILGVGGRPVIETASGFASFDLRHASGLTEIRGIDFRGNAYGNVIARAFDQLRVVDCTFTGQGTAGVVAGPTNVAGSHASIEASSFSGQLVGVFAPNAQTVEVVGSTFRDHSFSGIHFQQGTAGRIADNDVQDCGRNGCIFALTTRGVDISGNRLANAAPRRPWRAIVVSGADRSSPASVRDNHVAGSGEVHGHGVWVSGASAAVSGNRIGGARSGIFFANGASGIIEGNEVDPCGADNCINVGGSAGASIVVRGNTLRSVVSIRTFFGILSHNPADGGPIQIVGNTIEGVGAPANPGDQSTYPLQIAYQGGSWTPDMRFTAGLPLGAATTFSDNVIRNAEVGVRAFHGGVVEGRDNSFQGTFGEVLGAHDRGVNRLRFNDIVGYYWPLGRSDNGTGDPAFNGVLEVTCNWWGDASGPQNVGGQIPTDAYTPWATAPIAGSGATSCSGGI